MGRRWFTAAELSAYFSKPKKSFYSLAARNLLPVGSVIKLGRELRFDIAAIEAGAALSDRGKGRR